MGFSAASALLGHVIKLQQLGTTVEFRNVKLKPLGLSSIFNGRDLNQLYDVLVHDDQHLSMT